MLKGYTKIELTDVNTGEVEVIEDSNMVTNALAELASTKPWFLDRPRWVAWPENDTMNNNVARLTRGLLLFNKSLPEDSELIMAPGGVDLTGCGCEITYTNPTCLEMGSYNATESILDPLNKTYTWVWDFNETQANGEIGCACLTTQKGGRQTSGVKTRDINITTDYNTSIDYWYGRLLPCRFYFHGQTGKEVYSFPVYLDLPNNRFLQVNNFHTQLDLNNTLSANCILRKKSITITEYRIPGINNISLFDYSRVSASEDWSNYSHLPNKDIEILMPQSLINEIEEYGKSSAEAGVTYYYSYSWAEEENYIYFSFAIQNSNTNIIPINGAIYTWKIDVRDWSSTWFKTINTTGEPLVGTFSQFQRGIFYKNFILTPTQMMVRGQSNHWYLISRKNNNVVIQITHKDGTEYTYGDALYCVGNYANRLFFGDYNTYYQDNSGTVRVIDLETGHASIKNSYKFLNRKDIQYGGSGDWDYNSYMDLLKVHGYNGLFAQFISDDLLVQGTPTDNGRCLEAFYMSDLLITINNLPRIIKKTPSQKMKVTYTVKEA